MEQTRDIAVVDFSLVGLNKTEVNDDDLKTVGMQVQQAFSTSGFCYLTHHGVEAEVIEKHMKAARHFFEQRVEEKKRFVRGVDTDFGWIAVEREALNPERPGDLKEAFNFHPRDDPATWPGVEDFHQSTKALFGQCSLPALRFCDVLSVGLGLDRQFMRDAHKSIGGSNNETIIRSLFYPPLNPDTAIKPGQIRLGEHSDYGSFTILFQDDIGGLEVNVPGKGFVPASPIPGAVLVNIGDLMQRWTADRLIAAKHRVLIPETETKKRKCRQSCSFFVHPDHDYVVKCLDGSDKYEPIKSLDYLNYRFSLTY